jgi:microcystin-dependent protein
MVPFVAYEYYGSLDNFDGTGAGLNSAGFYKVYLCNGLNATPDKRGRVAVGAIADVVPIGVGLDAAVNPANPGNPNYAIFNTAGENTVVLTSSQMPIHNHPAVALSTGTISPNPHSHNYNIQNTTTTASGLSGGVSPLSNNPVNSTTSTVNLTVDINTGVTVSNAGGSGAHPNIQPVIAAYYIMYIP